MRTIFTLTVIMIGIGILVYVAQESISARAVPSLQEFFASTSPMSTNSDTNSSPATWLASTTMIKELLSGNATTTSTSTLTPLKAPKGILSVSVAKNPTTREKGLSGYTSLGANEGMLFIFPTEGEQSFWMKDMNFSIDIVWMDRYKKIIGVTPNISPKTYPKTFPSPGNVQFVLEVNARSAEKFGLREGTTVVF